VRKASHRGNKQQWSPPDEITLLLLVRATYIWVLFFAHIPFVVKRTFNATPTEKLQQLQFTGLNMSKMREIDLLEKQFRWNDLAAPRSRWLFLDWLWTCAGLSSHHEVMKVENSHGGPISRKLAANREFATERVNRYFTSAVSTLTT